MTVLAETQSYRVADATTGAATTHGTETQTTGTTATGAAEATGTSVGHAEAPKKLFPPLDPNSFAPQLIWFALTFGALYLLLSRVALPRVTSVIEARAAHIKRDLDEAQRLKSETDKALAEYEKALADAKGKANGIAQQTRDTLKTYTDQQRAKIDKQIADKASSAESQIMASKQAALGSVGTIAAETAEAIVGRLLGAQVSRDEAMAAVSHVRSN
jgi:F-type H+-transporting ATPase subunit b